MGLWLYDAEDARYYSDPCRKYITYDNMYVNGEPKTVMQQLQELRNALAISEILNRTLILPQFNGRFCTSWEYVKHKRCSIISYLQLEDFQTEFANFRETSFLRHTKVPASVKTSVSKINIIATSKDNYMPPYKRSTNADDQPKPGIPAGQSFILSNGKIVWYPRNPNKGATENELLTWFGEKQNSVLHFRGLLRSFCCFESQEKHSKFMTRIQRAFVKGTYHQQ